jgi:hypothetical protein
VVFGKINVIINTLNASFQARCKRAMQKSEHRSELLIADINIGATDIP